MRRIQAAASGSELVNEGVADSLLDMAVYCCIAFVLLGEDDPSVWSVVGGEESPSIGCAYAGTWVRNADASPVWDRLVTITDFGKRPGYLLRADKRETPLKWFLENYSRGTIDNDGEVE
jgi:hypothetical protein